ncbi:MAG: carbon-nitrogen hydrolase family protein [Gammaproteobacteria bacterium]
MNALRISVVQMNTGAEVPANLALAERLLRNAAADGARLAVLPENFAAMGPDDTLRVALAEPDGAGPLQDFLGETAARLGMWIVGGTLPLAGADPARPYSSCLVFDDTGSRRGRYDKIHLFDVDIPDGTETYRESAATSPGDRPLRVETPWGGLAVAVCYDLRFPELFRYLADSGFSLMAIPAAFTFATGQAHWHSLLRARAIENLCYVAAAAQTGAHPGGRRTFGHSMIIGPWGDTLGALEDEVGSIGADIDFEHLRALRRRFPALRHRRWPATGPID